MTPAEQQSWELHIEQADAIRALLDEHAPETEGNLQTRIAQVLAQSRQPCAQDGERIVCPHCKGHGGGEEWIANENDRSGQSDYRGWINCDACNPNTPPNAPQDSQVGDAERDVLAERRRQIESEGWTPEHDSEHAPDEMAQAAACYAHPNPRRYSDPRIIVPIDWPWDAEDWKPGRANPATTSLSTAKRLPDRRRDLVKAGALILAEIERYDRAAIRAGEKG